jgi:DNA primase
LEKHDQIHLFLDRDKAGLEATQQALKWSAKYLDKSLCYKHSKDLNKHLINQYQQQEHKQSHRYRMKF